jgi:leader peptidase (prepilin peptidase)/N-methyltransferase
MPFAVISAPLVFEDIRNHRLPNRIIYSAFVVTLLLISGFSIYKVDLKTFTQPIFGAAVSFFIAFLIYLIARGGFGAGDVKLFALTGLIFGIFTPAHMIAAAIFACLGVALYTLALLTLKRATRKTQVPFGPFIIIGSWLSIIIFN